MRAGELDPSLVGYSIPESGTHAFLGQHSRAYPGGVDAVEQAHSIRADDLALPSAGPLLESWPWWHE